jgi:hypothetical protein
VLRCQLDVDILLRMSNQLAEVRARQIVQRMRSLKSDVVSFGEHAKLLTSGNVDARLVMQEADNLVKKLMAARIDFQEADANINSVKRSLSSTVPKRGGIAPAALWGNEMRAASRQFIEAIHSTERSLGQLYDGSNAAMNLPTRTSTGDPSNAFDVLMNFVEMLSRVLEHHRRPDK